MARVEQQPVSVNQLSKEKSGRIKRAVLWVGEKSPFITFPLAGIVFVAGVKTGSPGLIAAGGVGMGVDVLQYKFFKRQRRKEAKKAGHISQETTVFTKAKEIFIGYKSDRSQTTAA